MTSEKGLAGRLSRIAPRTALGVALMSGALAGLGQAPFDIWLAAPIGIAAILLLVAHAPTAGRAAWRGFVGGAGYFALTLHWIVEPFFVEPEVHGWMAPFALVLFAGGMALFWSAAAWAAVRFGTSATARIVIGAAALLFAETLRGRVFTGFPWAQPGHALIDTPWLILAPIGGPLALTFAVLFFAALLGVALLWRPVFVLPVLAGLFAPYAFPVPPVPDPSEQAPVVRLVQPNAPQHLKWRPDMIPVFWQRGRDLAAATPDPVLGRPDLVIWPETSLPVLLERSDAARAQLVQATDGAPVLIGAQRFADGFSVRNSLALVGGDGALEAVYDKHHLVPFGEYLPFSDVADRLGLRALADIMPGGYEPGTGPVVFDLGPRLGPAFPMICYEAIFPRYIRDLDARPDWMVHATNDAWFGTFSGPWQHLALARLRAAEQGLPVLRAANTGISAVIDARGQVLEALPLGDAGYLDARLPSPLPPTLYSRSGDAPVLLIAALMTLLALATGRREKSH